MYISLLSTLNNLACVAAGPRTCQNHIVCLQISAQKLVLTSCRVARTFVSLSDKQVSYRFLMHLTIGLILTCVTIGLSGMSKFTRGVSKDCLL